MSAVLVFARKNLLFFDSSDLKMSLPDRCDLSDLIACNPPQGMRHYVCYTLRGLILNGGY